MKSAERVEFAGGTVAAFSHVGPNKETANEDAAAIIPFESGGGVLVVADGMGGHRAGDRAASCAVHSMAEEVARAAAEQHSLRWGIMNGFERANHEILELGLGAGTTLAVIGVAEDQLRTYHVGDSLILVAGQKGRVKLASISHSPVGYAVEAGLLDEREALQHKDRNLVSNVVGTNEMRIEVGPVLPLAPRDTVLLASDGLSDNLHTEEIVEIIRKGPLLDGVQQLAEMAKQRMTVADDDGPSKPDDLTIVAYRLD